MNYNIIKNVVYRTYDKGKVKITDYVDMFNHTELTYDGTFITAIMRDYEGNFDASYNGTVTFLIDGDIDDTFTTTALNGIAKMDFSAEVPGMYKIKTDIPDIRNGEVIVNV